MEDQSFPKYQFSKFTPDNGQWVVRSNDLEDFKKALANATDIFASKPDPVPAGDATIAQVMPKQGSTPRCSMHPSVNMIQAKSGKWYHKNEETGELCFGTGWYVPKNP